MPSRVELQSPPTDDDATAVFFSSFRSFSCYVIASGHSVWSTAASVDDLACRALPHEAAVFPWH